MDMEQRVKTLEQEMKILKNQVQKTLLDIQDQILVHYHPALRSEDDSLEESSAPRREMDKSQGDNGQKPAAIPLSQPGGLKVRQVSLADLRPSPEQPPHPSPKPAAPPVPPADEVLAGLANWVSESVGKIGAERTRKLLDLRTANGGVPADVADTLYQLVTLCEENEGVDAAETAVLLQQLSQLLK